MKKCMKDFVLFLGVIILAFLVGYETLCAIDAWDNTMSDREIISFLEKYPDSKKLNQMAEERNLIIEKK